MPSSPTDTATLNLNAASFVATSLSVVMILTFFVFFMSGSLLAVIVFWMVLVLSSVVLWAYGFISNDLLQFFTYVKPPPAPAPDKPDSGSGLVGMEVFHVDDNRFTYDEAPAACAAFGGNLATLEQVNEAYNYGAEWCGYGWSAGGLALFPTQRGTWEALQQEPSPAKRTACGKVGVNGGYFDPSYKFGVNCYGYKPAASSNLKLPLPPPGTNADAFNAMVNRFQGMLSSFTVSPYSRNQWSGYGALHTGARATADYGTQFQQNLAGLVGPETVAPPVKVSTSTTKESFVVNESDANILDPNRPGGYTYIQEPANVGAPGPGVAVPWWMMKNPLNPMGGTGPMGLNGMYGAGHGMGCGCGPCQMAAGMGPTGPMGPIGPTGMMGLMGFTGATGPMSVGTNVGNSAPVVATTSTAPTTSTGPTGPTAPTTSTPPVPNFVPPTSIGSVSTPSFDFTNLFTGIQTTNVQRVADYQRTRPRTTPLPTTAAGVYAEAVAAAPALGIIPNLGLPPPASPVWIQAATANAAAAERAAMVAAGRDPDK